MLKAVGMGGIALAVQIVVDQLDSGGRGNDDE
jgi:hypothetical protein